MVLSIKNREADALARELADLKRLPITEALVDELRRGVERERKKRLVHDDAQERYRKIMEIAERGAKLPVLDPRHPDEIMYDENGLPK